jgi:hypothetical protein
VNVPSEIYYSYNTGDFARLVKRNFFLCADRTPNKSVISDIVLVASINLCPSGPRIQFRHVVLVVGKQSLVHHASTHLSGLVKR